MLSAYLLPLRGVCLVRVKKDGSNGFIVPLNTQSFLGALTTSLKNEYLINPQASRRNLMRSLTNDYPNCDLPNLGYTSK
jgi:hypothetical protein